MTGHHARALDLGPVSVEITTNHRPLIDYLAEFYPLATEPGAAAMAWTIRAELGAPTADMLLTPWRVGHRADDRSRRLVLRASAAADLAVTARKAAREPLLDYCDAHGSTMLHAAALVHRDRVIVLAGGDGSGKTTLALDAVLNADAELLSNDHLICYRAEDHLVATSLPTLIPVKIGTYLDHADRLGEPWQSQGIDMGPDMGADLDTYRAMPRARRDQQQAALLYTYRRLGQLNPRHLRLTDREVVIVLIDYANGGQPSHPRPQPSPVAALWPHVRFDWQFNPRLNPRHLPRDERDRATYAHDAGHRLAEITERARVVRWHHHGHIDPLLSWLDNPRGGPR